MRSNFFYDRFAGFFVNGLMSFWSMYPPIFRDKHRLSLNHTAFSELAAAVTAGRSVGIHPEGTRNRSDDPYALLPAQNGIGRLIHQTPTATVVPVFINGLTNQLGRQVASNFTRKGAPIHIVFGRPIDFADLQAAPASTKTFRAIVERTMGEIAELGQQDKRHRDQGGLRIDGARSSVGLPPPA